MTANRDIELHSGMRFAKYMLLIVSFMFAITAVLLIMVGSTIQAIFYDFRLFVHDHFVSPAALLIAIGFILVFVATLGSYGGIKESVMLINLYGICLFLVFILEVSASIAAGVMRGQVRESLEATMDQAMTDYDNKEFAAAGVDFMQTNLQCCGMDGPKDWSKYLNPSIHNIRNGTSVPYSCCGIYYVYNNNSAECFKQYQNGCLDKMYFIISQNAMLIAGGAITVAFVQLLGSICAFMLAKTLRRHKSLREARRWQLQQSLDVLISAGKMAPPMTGYIQSESDPMNYTPNSPSVIN